MQSGTDNHQLTVEYIHKIAQSTKDYENFFGILEKAVTQLKYWITKVTEIQTKALH